MRWYNNARTTVFSKAVMNLNSVSYFLLSNIFINPKCRVRCSKRDYYTVVMIRHGESIWNLEKRFTGWCDIPLTTHGEADARDAGALIGERGIKFDLVFTSNLERAWRTSAIVLASSGQSAVETIRTWKLNERHYGALQGHLKNCPKLIQSFGEEKLIEFRRSYHTKPPSLVDHGIWNHIDMDSFRLNAEHMNHKYFDPKTFNLLLRHDTRFDNTFDVNPDEMNPLRHEYPSSESLKDCETRAFGYWNAVIKPRVKSGYRILIVAHANTIRALVKAMDNISDDQIAHLKIPNGVPLIYTLDENFEPVTEYTDEIGVQAKYLVSARNHKKLMQYERCTQKKLRSLFEYLDNDGDGRITQQRLENGLNELQHYTSDIDPNESISCEYNVEELLRCIPNADDKGGITLDAFLESEATLLPQLSRLRLLT